ncbi:MAG: TPR end-of-group domain-containing protein [bacterium]
MRAFGYSPRIELCHMGGLTYWGDTPSPSPLEKTIVSLAGPVFGLFMGGVVWYTRSIFLYISGTYGYILFRNLLWVNVGWGALNLLPMLPLDGGGFMEAIFHALTQRSNNPSVYRLSIVISAITTGLALYINWKWAAFIAAYCGFLSYQHLQHESNQKEDEILRPRLTQLWKDLQNNHAEHVVKECEKLIVLAKSDAFRASIVELSAWGYLKMGQVEPANEMIARMPKSYHPSQSLQGRLLFQAGYAREAIPYLQQAFQNHVTGFTIFELSQAFFEIGEYDKATSIFLDNRSCEYPKREYIQYMSYKLFRAHYFHHAMDLSMFSFTLFHCANDAYNVACACSRLNRPEDALVWLKTAIKAGYKDLEHIEADDDLKPIRVLSEYIDIISNLRASKSNNDI